jgi:hypothetical protein
MLLYQDVKSKQCAKSTCAERLFLDMYARMGKHLTDKRPLNVGDIDVFEDGKFKERLRVVAYISKNSPYVGFQLQTLE